MPLLYVVIDDGCDIRVKLLFTGGLHASSVVPEGALELHSPFVVPSTAVMPSVVSTRESILLGAEIRHAFLDYLIRSVL